MTNQTIDRELAEMILNMNARQVQLMILCLEDEPSYEGLVSILRKKLEDNDFIGIDDVG